MKSLIAAFLVSFQMLAAETVGPSAAPDAGSLLRQIQPVPVPAPSGRGMDLITEKPQNEAGPPSAAPFLVKTIEITGNRLFPTATLQALVADADGQTLTLAQLGEKAARISDYYHRHGYYLAQAMIPAQEIRAGIVTIQVTEAYYGAIRFDNRSRLDNQLLQDLFSPLAGGQAVSQAGLDHALLLLADVPGVVVSATLQPGQTLGTTDLMVVASPGQTVSGNVVLDDYGNRYTGRMRAGGTVNLNNPLHQGGILSASVLSSGRGLNYGRVAYEWLLNGQGTRLGGSYSTLHYILGGPLEYLAAHGTAQLASLWAKQPLVRSRNLNLYGQIQYDGLELRDHIDATGIQTDRHLRSATLSLAGDARDQLWGGGITLWRLDWVSGRVEFDNGAARLADAATAGTQGGYTSLNAKIWRLQNLTQKDSLFLAFSTQWANTNLDSSGKMIAGGPYTVRAYELGAVAGDTGHVGTVEFRHALGAAWRSQWQAVAFFDSAHVTINQTAWSRGMNSASLHGVGLGLSWEGPHEWSAKASIATRVGPIPALLDQPATTHLWVELSRRF
jgi:hemolysin activation/secretion protein